MAEVAGRTAFLKDDGFCTVEDGCLAVDPSGPASQTDAGVLIPAGMNLVSAYMSTEGGVELATLDVSGVESDILQVLYMGFRNDNRIIYLRTSSAVYSYDINMRVAKRIIGPVDDMKSGGMVYLRNGGTLSASTPGRETVSEYPQIMSYFRVQGYENSGVFKIIQRGGERVFVSPGKLYVLSDGRQSQIEISTIDRPGCKIADFQALPEGTTVNGKTWSYSAALADGAGGCFVRLYGDFRDGVQYADSEPVRLAGAIEQAVACGVASGIVYLATNYGFYYQDTSGNAFGAFTKLSETLPTLAGAGAAAGGAVAYSARR